MTSLLKNFLALSLMMALVPTSSFAQTAAPAKKKKPAKAKTEATTSPAVTTPAESTTSSNSSNEPYKGVRVAPGEVLNFNTEGPAAAKDQSQLAPVYTFKDSSEAMQAQPVIYNDAMADDTPFKTYIGYPKHKFELNGAPKGVNAKWQYKGKDFNFRTSTTAYGAAYNFVATPRFGMGVDYSHSTLKVDAAKTNGFNIASSSATFDTYFLRTHYCWFGTTSFAVQYCPEFVIGNDAYPILGFTSGVNLKMDKVQDLVVGVAMRFQVPVADKMLFHVTPGYNMGTGIGNSGSLTSKNNSTAYGLLGVDYEFNVHHSLGIEANFSVRKAKLSGTVGNNTDTWEINSTDIGGKLAYTFTL